MRNTVVLFLFFACLAFASHPGWAVTGGHRPPVGPVIPEYVEGEIIVRFASPGSPEQRAVLGGFEALGMKRARRLVSSDRHEFGNVYVLEMDPKADAGEVIETLSKRPDVLYAERNLILSVCTAPDDPLYATSGTWGQPYPDMWGLKKIGCLPLGEDSAWDIERDEAGEIVVAVIDSGMDFGHPDLPANLWINPGEIPDNGLDDDGNGYVDDVYGWDFINGDNDPSDGHGHGSHCAGTIAARTNNGIGVAGVSWGSRIMTIKGLSDSGSGTVSQLAEALLYAADNGAHILSNSWGGVGVSTLLEESVQYAAAAGCLVIAAAGNSNQDVEGFNFIPAMYPDCMAIGATDPDDLKATFSNYGAAVEVCAPGVDVLSLRAAGTDMYGDGKRIVETHYIRANGTSMACPHAAGAAALVWAANPTWSATDVRQQLIRTADYIDHLNPDHEELLGNGRLNVHRALTVSPQPDLVASGVRVVPPENVIPNGEIDPGETVFLEITLRNRWRDAEDVLGSLVSHDVYSQVLSGTVSFGSIPGGGMGVSQSPLSLSVLPDTPYGHPIEVMLAVRDGSGYEAEVPLGLFVSRPRLTVRSSVVLDDDENANGLLEPGETAQLILTLGNATNGAVAENASATLTSLHPGLIVHQPEGSFGSIFPGRKASNDATPFVVEMTSDFPVGEFAGLRIDLTSAHGYSSMEEFHIAPPGTVKTVWEVAFPAIFPFIVFPISTGISPDGTLHLGYYDYSMSIGKVAYAAFRGGIWSERVHVARHHDYPGSPLLTADTGGRAHLSWSEISWAPGTDPATGMTIRELFYVGEGPDWTKAQGMIGIWEVEALQTFAMAADTTGKTHLIWDYIHRNVSPNQRRWYHNIRENGIWRGEEVFKSDSFPGTMRRFALSPGPAGTLWLTWINVAAGQTSYSLEGMRWNGSNWSPATRFFTVPKMDQTQVSVGPDGRLHAVWTDLSEWKRWYAASDPNGSNWSQPVMLASANHYYYPNSLYMDTDGLLYFAYTEDGKIMSRVLEEGTWSQPEVLHVLNSGEYAGDVHLLVDLRGHRHLLWASSHDHSGYAWGYIRHVQLTAYRLKPPPTPIPPPPKSSIIQLR